MEENILRLLKQLRNGQEKTHQKADDIGKILHDAYGERYKGIKEQAAKLGIGMTKMKELRKKYPYLKDKNGVTLSQLQDALSKYNKEQSKHRAKK